MEATQAMEDSDALRRAGDRIARLLDELRELAPEPAWQRVEQLVHTMVELYGGGLERVLEHAWQACAPEGTAELRARLADDDWVASLLVLHGLHPLAPDERIRRALAARAHELGAIELAAFDRADGVARLRQTSLGASRLSPVQLERALMRLLEDVAPEVTRVELEGARRSDPSLVQIDLTRGLARGRRP
jgi:hypothetical protein